MRVRLLFIAVLLMAGVMPAAQPRSTSAQPRTQRTLILQQGRDGYTGVRDTFVSRHTWDTPPQVTRNYGQNPAIVVERNGGSNALLRVDLSAIPANSAVFSATLELYNTTASPGFVRRIELFQVVRDWDEGTQVDAPISGAGTHGATGNDAFDWGGNPPDVPWSAQGMAAPGDYHAAVLAATDVIGEGWYAWDVTTLVQQWVRGDAPNYGITLRDSSGYQDGNPDGRAFASSQAATAGERPRLTIVYNPDVPYADAGPDQKNLTWDGGAVALDGSASHDGPGGDDGNLRYAWRIVQPAYGSTLDGVLPITGATGQFTPDAAGDWELEVTVTNAQNESATDRVHLRLLRLGAAHPRIYLTPAKLAALQQRAQQNDPRWQQLLAYADSSGSYSGDHRMESKALVGAVTGDATYCTEAVALALDAMAAAENYGTKAGEAALVFDWCYASLSDAQRTQLVAAFNGWADEQMADPYVNATPGWGNYWPRYSFSFALIGAATFGDNARAEEWLNEYRDARFAAFDLPVLDHIAIGGDWPEGTVYDWIANPARVQALEAWRTATGENLFLATPWFAERLRLLLLQNFPGAADQYGRYYHPYPSIGDAERNRAALTNYQRMMSLILIERFPELPAAQQLQAYLAAPQASNPVWDFQAFLEFIFYNPQQPTQPPAIITNYAPAMGMLIARSGWPGGAADNDSGATYLTFRAGDHFSYHQHYDQGALTLFKYSDLLLDSGVYSGDGLSFHDINYYVRTIAHNTLIVYNAQEDFTSARADAVSNDGGQRTVYPATRSPQSEAEWQREALYYDTGDMRHIDEGAGYLYAAGDLTKAYNSPGYNQAQDTQYTNNTAKVTRFQREMLYFRPAPTGNGSAAIPADVVVLYDRVGVTAPEFSGANTKLLFHTMTAPVVAGTATQVSPGETRYPGAGRATVTNGPGKLFIDVLAPAQRTLRVVGGRGQKAFWVFGQNYDWHWDANEDQPRPTTEWDPEPYGEWRLELEPSDTALDHNFLTVLQPVSATAAALPANHIRSGQVEGVHIADPVQDRLALFAAAADGAAITGALSYSYQPITHTLTVIANLAPGQRYTLDTSTAAALRTVTLTPAAGGTLIANSAGVVAFVLQKDGELEVEQEVYVPLVAR